MKKTISLLLLSGILFAPMALLAGGETTALPATGPAALKAVPATAPASPAPAAAATKPAVKQSIHKKSAKNAKNAKKGSKGKTAKKGVKHAKKVVKKSAPATTTAPVLDADKPAI